MKTLLYTVTSLALALAFTATASCDHAVAPAGAPQGATIEEANETLTLSLVSYVGDVVTVDVVYQRREGQAAPRMMELWLDHGADLTFEDGAALSALETAGKELVVQRPAEGTLRLVAYAATNVAVVDSGPIARLTFTVRPGAGDDAYIAIEDRMPLFAPATANDGVLLGAPLFIDAPTTQPSGGKS